jgi:signal transduction histidine kinase
MRRRLLSSTVAIALAALTLLGVPIAFLLGRVVEDSILARLQRQGEAIALAVDDQLRDGRLPDHAELVRLTPRGDRVVVRLGHDRIDAGAVLPGPKLVTTVNAAPGARVRLETSAGPFDAQIRRSVLILLAVAGLGLSGAAVLAVVQARRFARPLEGLARASERLGAGDFSASVPRSGLAEIDAVAAALEAGGRRVAEMVTAERQFSAHASHQLRSALTGLSLALEDLAAEADPATRKGVAAALDQVTRLSTTVEELLHLARTGRAGEWRIFDATALVRQHVDDWRPRFARRRRAITFTAPGSLPVRAAPGALGQAIDVLVGNALVHGAGAAQVVLKDLDGSLDLTVADDGPGIDGASRARLFDAAKATIDGHGIGLALARLLVEAEGGALDLVDPERATFRIRLARAANVADLDGPSGEP